MNLTENGFSYSCTTCPKSGEACAAGLHLARQLSQALKAGGMMIKDDFELTGHGRITGTCGSDCGVVYSVCKGEIRIYCGVSERTKLEHLDAFASAFFGDGPVAKGPFPNAMIVGAQSK